MKDQLFKHKHRPMLVRVLNDNVDIRLGSTIKRRGCLYARADKVDNLAVRGYYEFLGLFAPYEPPTA